MEMQTKIWAYALRMTVTGRKKLINANLAIYDDQNIDSRPPQNMTAFTHPQCT